MANIVQYPSYLDCVTDILNRAATPLSIDVLVKRVQTQRPTGKGVRSAVYQAIGKLFQAVPVAPGTFGWLPFLLKGQTFRHPLNTFEVQRGNLLMDELEHAVLFPAFFQDHQPDGRLIRLHLMGGPIIEVHASVEQDTWALRLGQEFIAWVDQVGGSAYDDLLIHVLDAVNGEYGMRLQPREGRQEAEIQERNLQLAHAADAIVSGDRKSRTAMPVWELAAALVGRGVYAEATPPDDMHFVLHEYSNLRLQDDLGYTQVSREYLRQERRSGSTRSGGEQPLWLESDANRWVGGPQGGFLDRETSSSFGDSRIDDIRFWDEVEDNVTGFSDQEVDYCEAYQFYLTEFQMMTPEEDPLSHMSYHLLEAELETLVGLEQEFGYLMPDQEERKQTLAARLFIDIDMFYGGDWDQSDYDIPPF